MSVITSCCFLLSVLFLSLHACNGRPLPADDDHEVQKKFRLISNQNDQKEMLGSTVVLPKVIKSSSSNDHLRVVEKDGSVKSSQLEDNAQKVKDSKAKQRLLTDEEARKSGAAAAKKEPLSSVSWRVPQKKRGERNPGFNLDYSPPKTHPPSHN